MQRWKTEFDKSCINCCERDEGTRNKEQKVGERDVEREREREEETGDKSYL
jgi:hypothetical protein